MSFGRTPHPDENALDRALEELRSEGFAVLDDLDVGRDSVSHCVVGPTGVFAIEPDDDDHVESDEIERVVCEAATVERLLAAAGVSQDVSPVLAMTEAHGHAELDEVSVVEAWEVPDLVKASEPKLHE